MNKKDLFDQIRLTRSYLCVGLDPDPAKIPQHLHEKDNPVLNFNKSIIDATHDLCVAYKLNIAFYEAMGPSGWQILADTVKYIPKNKFVIADAKRGDIGNTSRMYAKTFFETYNFDAITVAPYMGSDSIVPFLDWKGKWVILLALTSNKGSSDFQFHKTKKGIYLYQEVIKRSQKWGSPDNLMYVIGSTHPKKFREIRKLAPDHFFLVPGIGTQGGDLNLVSEYGMNDQCGLLINSSRGIIYAGDGVDFHVKVRESAKSIQSQMKLLLLQQQLI